MTIKEKFTKITEMDVSTQGWDKTFEALNKEGRLDQKIMGKVLQALCETIDEIEKEDNNPPATIPVSTNVIEPENFKTYIDVDTKEEKGKANEKAEPVQST